MKRKILFLLLIMSLCIAFSLSVNAMSGSGTESDPYLITTADEFMAINNNKSACYRLEADLTLPMSTTAYITSSSAFAGVFDGNGHTITIDIQGATTKSSDTFEALFAIVTGQVKNLTVKGSATGSNKVAGIVGKLEKGGKIDNCVNYATIYGRKNVAGIAGVLFNEAVNGVRPGTKITNCANLGNISGYSIKGGVDMGGIVGCVWYTNNETFCIEGCYNEGTISVAEGESGENVGGIVGYFYCGIVKNCFNAGAVKSSNPSNQGSIFGKTDGGENKIDGYISLTSDPLIGYLNGKKYISRPFMLESDGVAIYLGSESGIRGEFHFPKTTFDFFASVSTLDLSSFEYGCVVSTKSVVESLGGDLLSQAAQENDMVVFAPAMKNNQVIYSFLDTNRGSAYHSYRFALTGFPNSKDAYNAEFVILGYVMITDKDGNVQSYFLNTVESDRLANNITGTDFNSVSILRVADATLSDGDFNGNSVAIDRLNDIVSYRIYSNSIEIDGIVNYGHAAASFTKHNSSDDTIVFKITKTELAEFYAYVNELEASGYEKVSENLINNNYYFTFKKDNTILNVVYWFNVKEATVSLETVTTLPENLTQPEFEKTNDPSITHIKLEASIPEGMSYVIHLSDGTFLIIDGGWSDANEKEADKLYNQLVALAGEGNDIVIAGWIFTHCHGDHIGTFNIFVNKYHNNVTIKEILYNFPADAEIATSGSNYMLNDTPQRYMEFKRVFSEYLKDTKYVKLHSGYKFYYADAEIEILQTFEDLYPRSVANNNYDFNSSSTLFTVTVGEQKFMFIGDVSDVGASRLTNVYGNSLKSDFLQVAHHGLNSNSTIKALYQKVDAKYILYPAPLSWYEGNINATANVYLATGSATVKQIFVSGAQTVTLYLPYDGKLFDGVKVPNTTIKPPVNEDNYKPVERPDSAVEVPDAYFDLDLSGGTAKDAAGNASVTVVGGKIEQTTVNQDDTSKTADAFVVDKGSNSYMTVNFNDITTDAQWGEFVMSSTTFEIFLKLDNLPGVTVGLITSCNGGGTTLYLRKQAGGQVNFQVGSTNANSFSDKAGSGNYSAAAPMNGDAPVISADELLHIVGIYDNESNMLKIFINGVLLSECSYGDGSFRQGSGNDFVIGIGYNPQYSGECLSTYAGYELYEARIYDCALTDEEVAQQYWNTIDNLLKEAVNE